MIDPVELTAELIRCASVTPADEGAIDTVAKLLSAHGFETSRCDRGGIANLFAKAPGDGPVFGFNGHTDVVPRGISPTGHTRPSPLKSLMAGSGAGVRWI